METVRSIRSIRLGVELRRLREKAQVKPQEACKQLGWSRSRLDRTEAGVNIPTQANLAAALDHYRVDPGTRIALEALRKEARAKRKGWWDGFTDLFQSSLPIYEDSASRIRVYEDTLVPGLFQTPDYAREIFTAMRPEDMPESIDRRVQARIARQALVARQSPPDIHVIISEAVLRHRVGGKDVMDAQLSALWAASRRPHVTLQIVPFDAGAHAGMDGPFMILSFDEPIYPEVGFVEGQGGDVYLEGAADLDRINLTWDRLALAALSPEDSASLLAEMTRE